MKKTILLSLIIISFPFIQSKIHAESPQKTAEKAQAATAALYATKNTALTEPRQITFVGPKSGEGYFSADGNKMIFQSERTAENPFYQMFVLDFLTGKTTQLSPGNGKTTCGWIHPNMKKALWASTHQDPDWKKKKDEEYENRTKAVKAKYAWSFDDTYDIYESDLKGKSRKKLTKAKGYDAEASYSPDGNWIAYASNSHAYSEKLSEEDKKLFAQDPSSQMEIYIMKSNGQGKKRLTNTLGYDGGPFFSPDGKKITWRRFATNGATAEILTMNVDGSDQKQITQMNALSWAPFFHPSGDYIIFTSSVLGYSNFELFIIDSEGKHNPVRVTFDEGFDGLPAFHPRGDQITWTHRNEKGESQILLAHWNDSEARRLLGLPGRPLSFKDLSPQISSQDARKIIRYMTSAELGGRPTAGSQEIPFAESLVQLFKAWGLKGGGPKGEFIHEFEFTSGVNLGAKNSFQILREKKSEVNLTVSQDYLPSSTSASGTFSESDVIFAGYGLKIPSTHDTQAYDSYKNIDAKGKWVAVLRDFPLNASPVLKQQMLNFSQPQHKITVAKNEGAIGVIFINGYKNGLKENFSQLKFEGSLSDNSIPVVKVKTAIFEKMMGDHELSKYETPSKADQAVQGFELAGIKVKAEIRLDLQKSKGRNVIARLPGGLSKSAVLIGAHGDHLGTGLLGSSLATSKEQGQIHPGADDNASGVAAVLELAHYFSSQKKTNPKSLQKDLYFAVWSGEEVGVLGSSQYVKDWGDKFSKTFEAGMNMDMVGRLREKLHVQGVASGDHWTNLSEEISLRTGMQLSLQEDPYLPTDSMAIYLGNVPSISFFTGAHPEYHTPRDVESLINFDGLQRTIEVVKTYTQLLSDSSARIVRYKKVESKGINRGAGQSFRLYLGTIPDYSQEGVKGVRISGVSKGSPAEKAGLKEKDVIVEFAGAKIENIYDYVYSLQTVKPSIETSIKVKRGDITQELKIVPSVKE
ncbi:MAG: M28 family peptidase [Bdellovibrionota bacterium]